MRDVVAERPGFRGYGRDFKTRDWARAHRDQWEDWQAGRIDLHDGRLLGNPKLKRRGDVEGRAERSRSQRRAASQRASHRAS